MPEMKIEISFFGRSVIEWVANTEDIQKIWFRKNKKKLRLRIYLEKLKVPYTE